MRHQWGENGVLGERFVADKTDAPWEKISPLLLLNVIMFSSDIWNSGSHFMTMRAKPEIEVNPPGMAERIDEYIWVLDNVIESRRIHQPWRHHVSEHLVMWDNKTDSLFKPLLLGASVTCGPKHPNCYRTWHFSFIICHVPALMLPHPLLSLVLAVPHPQTCHTLSCL